MVCPNPSHPSRLVGGVLRTCQIPNKLDRDLSAQFRVMKEYGGALSVEVRSSRGIYSFLGILAFGIDPVPGFSVLALLAVYWDGSVHLLHYLFYIPFFSTPPPGICLPAWRIFPRRFSQQLWRFL